MRSIISIRSNSTPVATQLGNNSTLNCGGSDEEQSSPANLSLGNESGLLESGGSSKQFVEIPMLALLLAWLNLA